MARLLVTSAGSLVGDAILRCLDDLRPRLTVIGVNSIAAPAAFGCDLLFRVPPTADRAGYTAALGAVLEREAPDLVLAGRDEDVPVLAALAAAPGAFPRTAFPLPPPGLAPVFADKAATCDFAVRHGLPFAPTATGIEGARELASGHGFPLIAKPRSGAGSQGVLLLRDMAELERAAAGAGLIVQPFLAPQGIGGDWSAPLRPGAMPWFHGLTDLETTAELLITPEGRVEDPCCDRGVTAPPLRCAVELIADEAVSAVGRAWGEALAAAGHRGPVNIQGKRLPDGRFVPYEIAARFGGTAVARALLGRNLVRDLVCSWLGWPRGGEDAPRRISRTGLTPCRLSVPRSWRRRFEDAGEWHAPADRPASLPRPRLLPDPLAVGSIAAAPPGGALPDGLGGALPDRLALADHARRYGLPFVPTAASPDGMRVLGTHPPALVVVKPRRGDGPVRLAGPGEAAMLLTAGDVVAQPALGAAALADAWAQWRALAGLPWLWSAADRVELVEGIIAGDGSVADIRSGLCLQRGGEPAELRLLDDPPQGEAMAEALRRWGASLASLGHRGPLRLTGQRDAAGRWLPFSASGRPLGLPDSDGDAAAILLRPMPAAD